MSIAELENTEVQEIIERALKLPPSARKNIAIQLFESARPPEDPEAVTEAWRAELSRRVADIDSGKVKMIPLAESMAYLRQRLSEVPGG